jgi:hypothetical protein
MKSQNESKAIVKELPDRKNCTPPRVVTGE